MEEKRKKKATSAFVLSLVSHGMIFASNIIVVIFMPLAVVFNLVGFILAIVALANAGKAKGVQSKTHNTLRILAIVLGIFGLIINLMLGILYVILMVFLVLVLGGYLLFMGVMFFITVLFPILLPIINGILGTAFEMGTEALVLLIAII